MEKRDRMLLIFGIITTVLLGVIAIVLWKRYIIAVRSHNLDTFYRSLTCGDLPISSNMDVSACEKAIGEFMIQEHGLFTRGE